MMQSLVVMVCWRNVPRWTRDDDDDDDDSTPRITRNITLHVNVRCPYYGDSLSAPSWKIIIFEIYAFDKALRFINMPTFPMTPISRVYTQNNFSYCFACKSTWLLSWGQLCCPISWKISIFKIFAFDNYLRHIRFNIFPMTLISRV